MRNITVKTKLLSLLVSSMFVVSITILIESTMVSYDTTAQITQKFEKNAYSSKENELKSNVQIAYKVIESFYKMAQKDEKNEKLYKKNAIQTIKNLKYGKSGYFWISNSKSKIITHPNKTNAYKETNGKYLLDEAIRVSRKNKDGGLVKYNSLKLGLKYPKFSYVILFKPWDWIIGTQTYVGNIDDLVDKTEDIAKNSIIHNALLNVFTILITIFIFFIIVLIITKKSIFKPFYEFQTGLLDFFEYLKGEKKEVTRLNNNSDSEIGLMSKAINAGIIKVEETMKQKAIEEWTKDGISKLNQILIKEKEVQQICDKSIDFICSYLNAGIGVFYLFDEKKETLLKYASYAHVVRNDLPNVFKLKEGIVGQVAFQRKPILLKNIKKDEALITTGTIIQSSTNTYTFPLVYNENLYGVIEIGTFSEIEQKDLDYLKAIEVIICLPLLNAFQNKKVKELLEDTKKANKKLEENQLKLEEANTYMQNQQRQLENVNINLEEQQQQLIISEQNLKLQNQKLEDTKQEITKKANELEKTGKYKSEFLANMSHELRTPLNSIILLSSLFQKNSNKNLTKDDIKKAKTIFDSGNDLLRLINDILDLSKVESGKMDIIIDTFTSSELLSQMEDLFEYTALDKGLSFNVIDEYKGIIKNDRAKLAQIVKNLISNSIKFTKKGLVTFKISSSNDLDFKISVIDTGIGISKKKQNSIFKAFAQADGSTSREYGGTGLGLSITKEFTKLLGGYISLSSQENKGSIFSLDLPNLDVFKNKKSTKEIIKTKDKKLVTTKQISVLSDVCDDRNIMGNEDEAYLVVDDNKIFAQLVYEEIKKNENFALIALNAKSGLELVKKYNIKGILLDLTLPDMDGIDVLKQLKTSLETKHIPVHIISSKDKSSETFELGAIGYHQKPIFNGDIDNILATINKFSQKEIKNLLIVENKNILKEIVLKFTQKDVNVTSINSVEEAIEGIKKEVFDTIIIDFALKDTYEVCEFVKSNYPALPIVIYTNYELAKEDKTKLQEYSNNIIMKTTKLDEKILSEINLFFRAREKESKEIFENIDLKGTNILIVDDDIKNIFVLDTALKEFNANTFTTFNGQEALDFLKDNDNIDLILMDIMMPVMNGYEIMEKIRKTQTLKHIPIIAVTARAMKEDRQKCIKLGADDYISKPININILAKLIKVWSKKRHK